MNHLLMSLVLSYRKRGNSMELTEVERKELLSKIDKNRIIGIEVYFIDGSMERV